MAEKGKRTGRNDHWIKVRNDQDEEKAINCTKTAIYQVKDMIEDENRDEVCNVVTIPTCRHGEEAVMKAKANELTNWKQREVYDEVKSVGQQVITTTWVVTEKPSY